MRRQKNKLPEKCSKRRRKNNICYKTRAGEISDDEKTGKVQQKKME